MRPSQFIILSILWIFNSEEEATQNNDNNSSRIKDIDIRAVLDNSGEVGSCLKWTLFFSIVGILAILITCCYGCVSCLRCCFKGKE